MKRSGVIFKVPNTEEGVTFYKLARKYLTGHYKLTRRARGKNRKGKAETYGFKLGFCHDIPIHCADSFAIYIRNKY